MKFQIGTINENFSSKKKFYKIGLAQSHFTLGRKEKLRLAQSHFTLGRKPKLKWTYSASLFVRLAQNSVEIRSIKFTERFRVSWKSARWKAHFTEGRRWICLRILQKSVQQICIHAAKHVSVFENLRREDYIFLMDFNQNAFNRLPRNDTLFRHFQMYSFRSAQICCLKNRKTRTNRTHRARTVSPGWQAQWSRRRTWWRSTSRSPVQMQ